MSDADVTIQRLAAARGPLSHDDLTAAGLSNEQIKRRLARGALGSPHRRGLYLVAAIPDGYAMRLRAALLATKGRGVVSHRSAAALWGFPVEPAMPEITVVGEARPRMDGVIVHRVRSLENVDRTTRGGLAITTPSLTLLDCAWPFDEEELERCVEFGLYQGLLTIRRVRRVLDRLGGHGRRGTAPLRALLDLRDPDLAPTESELELLMGRVFRQPGVPQPVRQHWVTTLDDDRFRLDNAYVDIKLAVEVDGRVCHSGQRDFLRDRQRGRALVRLGWALLCYTWPEVKRHAKEVAKEITAEVERRRSLVS